MLFPRIWSLSEDKYFASTTGGWLSFSVSIESERIQTEEQSDLGLHHLFLATFEADVMGIAPSIAVEQKGFRSPGDRVFFL